MTRCVRLPLPLLALAALAACAACVGASAARRENPAHIKQLNHLKEENDRLQQEIAGLKVAWEQSVRAGAGQGCQNRFACVCVCGESGAGKSPRGWGRRMAAMGSVGTSVRSRCAAPRPHFALKHLCFGQRNVGKA